VGERDNLYYSYYYYYIIIKEKLKRANQNFDELGYTFQKIGRAMK